ncbi:MAG: AAA family ATPase, partial [Actinomycetota bacterium]
MLSGPASTSQVAPAGGPPGRAAEFATMRAALERVSQTGAGETLLLSAAAGVGKTRLVEELVGPAASTGTTVVWSRCDEGASNLPLWPWASGLRDLIDGRDPDEVEALLDADRGALASFVPGLTDTTPLTRDDPSERYQAFDSTMRVLRRLADTAPVIWAIEDLHWADAASREMAVFIARRLADVPILLVITARDHDLDHPTIAELIQVPMTTHLALGHLDVDGVVELVQVARPDVGDDLARPVGRALHDRTGGNPLFALQLLDVADADDPLGSITGAQVPGGLASAVLARLTSLPDGTTELLTVASAARSEWTLEVSGAVAGIDMDTAIDAVEAAEGAGLVEEVPDLVGAYRFAHALVGESLYGRLSSMRRARLHARLGATVEERRAGDGDPATVVGLARHYCLGAPAGTGLDGARWAVRAAQQSIRRHDSESGLELVRDGLAALDHVRRSGGDDADRRAMLEIDLWCERSECERRLDRPNVADLGDSLAVAAQQSAETAFSIASNSGSVQAMATAALTYCGDGDIGPWLGYWFDDPTGERMIDEVLAHPDADELGDATRIRLLNRLADVDHDGRPVGRGEATTAEALERARHLGDTRLIVEALNMRHTAAHYGHDADERLAVISEMLDLAKGAGLVRHEVLARRLMLGHAIESVDRAGEDEQLAEIAALGDRSGDDGVAFIAAWVPVSVALFRGDLDAATEGLTDAATRFAHFEEAMLDSLNLQLAQLLREQHQMISIESVLRDRLAVQPSPAWRAPLAVALAEHDRRDEAQELLDSMPDADFTEISEGPLQFLTPSLMADAVAHLDDVCRAEQLLGFLEPFADRLVNFSAGLHYHGWLGYHVGRLCRVVGRHDDARRHLDGALDRCARSEARPAELRCRVALVELDRAEGRAVDTGVTSALVDDAVA